MANTAPVLNISGDTVLPSILQGIANEANTGISILDLAGSLITDSDNGLEAIVITGADSTNGTWQYSTNGGTTWQNFPGGLSGNNALVLGAQALYVPGVSGTPPVPGTQDWLFYNNPPGAIQSAGTDGTILDTSANAALYAGYSNYDLTGQPQNPSFPMLDRTQGYSLAFETRIISNNLVSNARAGFNIIVVSSDGLRAIELAFQSLSPTTGRIFAQSDDVTSNPSGQPQVLFTPAEGVDFNTNTLTGYRLEVVGNNYVLFANGTQILTGPLRNYSNFQPSIQLIPDPYNIPNFVFLGDNTTSASGRFELGDVAVQTATRLRFVPNAGFSGNVPIGFRAWDSTDGSTNGSTVNITAFGGNTAYSSTVETATISVIPLPPTIGAIATDNIINAAEAANGVVISGTTNAGATVNLTVAGQTYFIQTNGTTWSYTLTAQDIINLGQGSNRTVAAVANVAGNLSQARISQPFTIDTVPPPAATIGAIATDNIINADEAIAGVVLTGTTGTGTTVSLNIAGATRNATVNGTSWSYTLAGTDLSNLGQGAGKTITVTARDSANNTTDTQSQPFTVETGAPSAPTIGAIATNNIINAAEAANGVVLSGSTDAGTTVSLTIAGVTRTASVDGGTWTYTLTNADLTNLGQGTGKSITAIARNTAGTETSTLSQSFDIDTIAPAGISLNNTSIPENNSINTAVATLSATDTGTVSYTLVAGNGDANNDAFRIENNQLFLTTSADFESQTTQYSVRIRVRDAAGNSTDISQTLTIANVNEAVTAIALSDTLIPQNIAGAVIGTLTVTDPDAIAAFRNNTLTVSDNRFEVLTNNNALQLKLRDGQSLNYGDLSNGQLALTVTATDATETDLTFSTLFNLSVIGTEAADTFVATPSFDRILAGAGADTVTATVANLGQSDALDGGEGSDRLTISAGIPAHALSLNLSQPNAQLQGITGLTVQNFEQFDLTNFAGRVTVQGSPLADVVLGGAGNDLMVGGSGNDTFTGGGGNDSLDGGLGADSLRGGLGNDLYTVDNGGDRLTEALNQGIDTVRSSITWALGNHLENLVLTGSRNINGVGNTRNNSLTGNRGNNTLSGGAGSDRLLGGLGADVVNGGAGNDSLTGGGGRDSFQFAAPRSFRRADFGVDRITDFLRGQDRITLSARSFTRLSGFVGRSLNPNQFASVTSDAAAGRVGAAIAYNRLNGRLFYNANGTAAGFGTGGQFATLQTPQLTRSDVTVIA